MNDMLTKEEMNALLDAFSKGLNHLNNEEESKRTRVRAIDQGYGSEQFVWDVFTVYLQVKDHVVNFHSLDLEKPKFELDIDDRDLFAKHFGGKEKLNEWANGFNSLANCFNGLKELRHDIARILTVGFVNRNSALKMNKGMFEVYLETQKECYDEYRGTRYIYHYTLVKEDEKVEAKFVWHLKEDGVVGDFYINISFDDENVIIDNDGGCQFNDTAQLSNDENMSFIPSNPTGMMFMNMSNGLARQSILESDSFWEKTDDQDQGELWEILIQLFGTPRTMERTVIKLIKKHQGKEDVLLKISNRCDRINSFLLDPLEEDLCSITERIKKLEHDHQKVKEVLLTAIEEIKKS